MTVYSALAVAGAGRRNVGGSGCEHQGSCEAKAARLSYGRQRLYGARVTESSSVKARSCRALAGTGGGSGYRYSKGDSGLRYGREKMK